MKQIVVCPGNLAPGYNTYSPRCIKHLFNGKRVSPILDFDYDADSNSIIESINHISISGVQEKLSAIVKEGKIRLTSQGEHGRYIIKPAPSSKHLKFRGQMPANEHLTMQIAKQIFKIKCAENGIVFFANGDIAYISKHFKFRGQMPANEHLTMQIAKQIFKIKCAENGIVFFANGDIAYITKRFDYDASDNKIKQEDFSSLAQKSSSTHGKEYKYTGSYEDVAAYLLTAS